ncbi:MAG: hypothetical protein AAFR31_07995 [Cyanobacteria bacterium J06627_8]
MSEALAYQHTQAHITNFDPRKVYQQPTVTVGFSTNSDRSLNLLINNLIVSKIGLPRGKVLEIKLQKLGTWQKPMSNNLTSSAKNKCL